MDQSVELLRSELDLLTRFYHQTQLNRYKPIEPKLNFLYISKITTIDLIICILPALKNGVNINILNLITIC